MDFAKLKTLIAADATLEGKTPQEIAAALNEQTLTTYRRIEPPTVMMWLIPASRRQKLADDVVAAKLAPFVAAQAITEQQAMDLRNFAWGLLTMIHVPGSYIDYSLETQQAAAAAFVVFGILSQEDVDALVQDFVVRQSRAEASGCGAVTAADVLNCQTF